MGTTLSQTMRPSSSVVIVRLISSSLSLLGFTPIPRDAKNPGNGHVRFCPADEARLTAWMKDNLLVYYFPNDGYEVMEDELIAALNPPLNLSKNANPVNSEIRALISRRRSSVKLMI